MKPRRLFGIALLFPYLFWGISLLIGNEFASLDLPDFWNFLLTPIMFYAVGALFWFIPYTLLAIGLWIWSINKSVVSLRKAGLLAPIYLSILVTIGYVIYSLISYLPKNGETVVYVEAGTAILGFIALLVASSLFFGYLFVGIGLTVYKLFLSKNLIVEDS